MSPLFSDPDGDSLTLTVESEPPDAFRMTVSGSFVELHPLRYARGANVLVTATDPTGRKDDLSLWVGIERLPVPILPPPDPRKPRTTGPIPSRQLLLGELTAMALERLVIAPPTTTFSVTSSSDAVQASVAGDSLVLDPRSLGPARIVVTASNEVDASLHSVHQALDVVVHPPGTPPNDPPRVFWTRPRIIPVGFSVPYAISEYFRDPEDRPLTFSATSEAPSTVAVSVAGNDVILEGKSRGEAVIILVATDPGGLLVRTPLQVSAVRVDR